MEDDQTAPESPALSVRGLAAANLVAQMPPLPGNDVDRGGRDAYSQSVDYDEEEDDDEYDDDDDDDDEEEEDDEEGYDRYGDGEEEDDREEYLYSGIPRPIERPPLPNRVMVGGPGSPTTVPSQQPSQPRSRQMRGKAVPSHLAAATAPKKVYGGVGRFSVASSGSARDEDDDGTTSESESAPSLSSFAARRRPGSDGTADGGADTGVRLNTTSTSENPDTTTSDAMAGSSSSVTSSATRSIKGSTYLKPGNSAPATPKRSPISQQQRRLQARRRKSQQETLSPKQPEKTPQTNPKSEEASSTDQPEKQQFHNAMNNSSSRLRAGLTIDSSPEKKASTGGQAANTLVYIKDDAYGWLPAQIVSLNEDVQAATVCVVLPRDWTATTMLSKYSTIEEIEEALGVGRGQQIIYDDGSTLSGPPAVKGASQFNSNRRSSAHNKDGKDDDSSVTTAFHRSGVTRTISLKDYTHWELPLQNYGGSGINGKLMVKADMADLQYLHEAAILYNLKERHAQLQPYTRVGEIVVAMNPFQWIDGLYSEEKQRFYADRVIWNPPKTDSSASENGEDKENDEDDAGKVDVNHEQFHASDIRRREEAATLRNTLQSKEETREASWYDRLGYDPHIYETASAVYRGLAVEGKNQTILVSGESGAGKTESVKIVMTHLATVEETSPAYYKLLSESSSSFRLPTVDEGETGLRASETVRRVLESNPVFEAFGNAKTVRNDNSSRFGKFTQLQFDVEDGSVARRSGRDVPRCSLAGSVCTTYLLEKSRVVGHDESERTYHIFYQLLATDDDTKSEIWYGLEGRTHEDFLYVGETDNLEIEGRPDEANWHRTVEALKLFGIEGDELTTLMRALCVVLQLGNLTFEVDPAFEQDDDDNCAVITSTDELELLADLLGITPDDIEAATTLRSMKARGEEYNIALSPFAAKEGCDALAKEIYSRIFDVLSRRINDYTAAEKNYVGPPEPPVPRGCRPKPKTFGTIGLLDIFGFERFDTNRFEQLCINYANERLQQQYVLDNFRAVQKEYEAEGIQIFDFTVVDNTDVLNLLQGKLGLLEALNEECLRPKGNDASFVYKLKMVHSDSKHLLQDRLHRPTEFGIVHFAGSVTYDGDQFIARNTDSLPQDLLECACKSSNNLIQTEFQSLASSIKQSKRGAPRKKGAVNKQTVATKFKAQLTTLMAMIESTSTRYIRCIKPNALMVPRRTDHQCTLSQLECAGLVTAIAISRETFPNRLAYDVTFQRFKCLLPQDEEGLLEGHLRRDTQFLLAYLLSDMTGDIGSPGSRGNSSSDSLPFACGKTKVYFRTGALERLETERVAFYVKRAVTVQRWIRRYLAMQRFQRMQEAIVVLQAWVRMCLEREHFLIEREAAVTLQCFGRCLLATEEVLRRREDLSVVRIQSSWRRKLSVTGLQKIRSAATKIQSFVRAKKSKTSFTAKLAVCVEEARMNTKLQTLQQQVEEELSVVGSTSALSSRRQTMRIDESLLGEIEVMFVYLRNEIYVLRQKNSSLEADILESEHEKKELFNHVESMEASAEVSKRHLENANKANEALLKEVMKHKEEISSLKADLKTKQVENKSGIAELRREFERELATREEEIRVKSMEFRAAQGAHSIEVDMLKEQLEKAKQDHVADVKILKKELRGTQDSHHEYLTKIMDVLETTHQAREAETSRLNAELERVTAEKDGAMQALKAEMEAMRAEKREMQRKLKQAEEEAAFRPPPAPPPTPPPQPQSRTPTPQPETPSVASSSKGRAPTPTPSVASSTRMPARVTKELRRKRDAILAIRDELSHNEAARHDRVLNFRSLTDELERQLAGLSVPGNAETSRSLLGRKSKKKEAEKSARAEEDLAVAKRTLEAIRDLYNVEERSHAYVDLETLRTLDVFLGQPATGPAQEKQAGGS